MKSKSNTQKPSESVLVQRRHLLISLIAAGIAAPGALKLLKDGRLSSVPSTSSTSSTSSTPSTQPPEHIAARPNGADHTATSQQLWVSAQGMQADDYGLGWVNAATSKAGSVASGFRGHGLAQHPVAPQRIVMMARHPGNSGIELDANSGLICAHFTPPENRRFDGHACFSADGKTLYTSETNTQNGDGIIGVYSTDHYQRSGEFSSGGIEPHEIKLMPDNATLVVANGGLRKTAASGRNPINLDTMQSTLVYINAATGELISEHRVSEPKASIRHLDVAPDGTVAVATQVQRAAMTNQDVVALGAVQRPGQELQMLQHPEPVIMQLNDYMGSVAIHPDSGIVGFTSPRGDLAVFWNTHDQAFVGYHQFHDVCGLTVSQDRQHFVLSNSAGEVRQLNATNLQEVADRRLQFGNMHWDNHLYAITT